MITLEEYGEFIKKVDRYPDSIKPTIYLLGAIGELGELINKWKKVFRDHGGQIEKRPTEFLDESGDVLWYLFAYIMSLGFTPQEVIDWNYEKLNSRWKRGKIHGSGDHR